MSRCKNTSSWWNHLRTLVICDLWKMSDQGDMPHSCQKCNQEADEEFCCRACNSYYHYECALGFSPPAQLKDCEYKADYICLLHMGLEAHQREWDTRRNSSGGSHSDTVIQEQDSQPGTQAQEAQLPGSISLVHRRPSSNNGDSVDGSDPLNSAFTGDSGRNNHTHEPFLPTPLHPSCEAKAKKLLLGLNNTKTLPKHASTLLIGNKSRFLCQQTWFRNWHFKGT